MGGYDVHMRVPWILGCACVACVSHVACVACNNYQVRLLPGIPKVKFQLGLMCEFVHDANIVFGLRS